MEFTFATKEQIKQIIEVRQRATNWQSNVRVAHRIKATHVPWDAEKHSWHMDFPDKYLAEPSHVCPHDYQAYYDIDYQSWTGRTYKSTPKQNTGLNQYPFFVHVEASDRYDRSNFQPAESLQIMASEARDPFVLFGGFYNTSHYYGSDSLSPTTVGAIVNWGGVEFILTSSLLVAQSLYEAKLTDDMTLKFANGAECDFPINTDEVVDNISCYRGSSYRNRVTKFDYTAETLEQVNNRFHFDANGQRTLIRALVKKGYPFPELKQSGIAKTLKRLQSATDDLLDKDPLAFVAFRTLIARSSMAVDGVKISVIFNEIFKGAQTADDMIEAMQGFYGKDNIGIGHGRNDVEEAIKEMPLYVEKRKAVLKSQANRAFNKVLQEAESLKIDKKKYKRTWKAIEEGKLPIGTFFRKQEQYFILNDNWALWEEMIKRGYEEQTIELANEVKGRTTYEKDLMSYLYFVLYGLPAYLKKHTGLKWECRPKLVTSSEELEPPKEDDDGVARSRSALTPIVDNEAKTVDVPYASLCISGYRQNTYCYSHDYHVLTKGFSFNGNVVMEDLEKGLNGRDDYGLMFYTLTGSAQGRGYPTFLIIFERRTGHGDTRVHFHRTHPSRSKDGDYNPIHNWIKVCYNWMAGNIKRNRIKAQQGDLAFVQIKSDKLDDSLDGAAVVGLEFDHQVDSYDSHCFESPVAFAEYTKKAKSNILGYVKLESDTWLRHPEHDDVLIPLGTYAIHQCRSWEANPKGIWSLNID